MGKEALAKLAAPEIMLPREDVPVIAMLALMETLLIDMDRVDRQGTGNREMRLWRAEIRANMMKQVKRQHSSFAGRVTDELILKCDRYLCRVQDSLDNFFDDLTDEDLAFMERVKANWPQHKDN